MKSLPTFAAVLLMVASASAANAVSYTGNWPITVSHSLRSDGTYCLVVTDDGSQGWPHSGEASLPKNNLTFGTFQLIQGLLVATIQQPGQGQNAGLVFTARASNGSIGRGVFEQVYGGEDSDSGVAVFGTKNGC